MSPADDAGGLDGHGAFLALHRHAGNVPENVRGVALQTVAEALTEIHDAPDVPDSARLDVLAELARADFPDAEEARSEYVTLASRVAGGEGEGEQLLDDLKAHAVGDQPFTESVSYSNLAHEVVAFFGEDVCHSYRVDVDGKTAVWLFSEFETDAPFESVAGWVDPVNWPKRSPMVFKSMKPLGAGVEDLPGNRAGRVAWHGNFEETVTLAKELRTELHIDFTRVDGLFAGSTYELRRSIDNEIDVDRGFLLVNELGESRNVKCLKVVGFTDDYWDLQALDWACLGWTHFIKEAVRGGTKSDPTGPQRPQGDYKLQDVAADWFDCVSEAGQRYVKRTSEWVERARHGYDFDSAVRDTAALWISIAREWSNATAEAYANLQRLAAGAGAPVDDDPLFAALFTPDAAPAAADAGTDRPLSAAEPGYRATMLNQGFTAGTPGFEGATIAWPGLVGDETLECTDMVRLGAQRTVVPKSSLRLSTVPVGDRWYGVHLEMPVAGLPAGLYIGDVTADKRTRAFQIYVSRATGSSSRGG